jgi:diphthamide synthase (EF-2-diphthine--ammonia ligase)
VIVESLTTDGPRVGAALCDGAGVTHRLHWKLPEMHSADPTMAADAALTAALLPAMARVERVRVADPVSARLLANLPKIQDVFVSWSRQSELMKGVEPVFRHVSVDAVARESESAAPSGGVAAFFSGGVDSFYTALKHRHEITALVFVHGFDVSLDDHAQRDHVVRRLRRAADELKLPLLEVETDVREFLDLSVHWLDAHGAALAGVAQLLGGAFRRLYVPSTDTYGTLAPMGSHPLVDPLWSTERVEIVHDGCEANRVDKLRAIEGAPAAREGLRVCVRKGSSSYNCGECWKCLRTMVGLRVLGTAARFDTLPVLDEPTFLRRLATVEPLDSTTPRRSWSQHRAVWKPYLDAAESAAQRRRLEAALAVRFARGRVEEARR